MKWSSEFKQLAPDEVKLLAELARSRGQDGERNALLILLLSETGLSIPKVLSLTPSSIQRFDGEHILSIIRKWKKPVVVACPEWLADKLKSFAYDRGISPNERFFKISGAIAREIIYYVLRIYKMRYSKPTPRKDNT